MVDPRVRGGAMLRAFGLMDGEFALRQDALDALLRIDREEPFAVMAAAVAEAIAGLAGHEAAKLRKLLDLIADGKLVSLDIATNHMKAP